MRPDPLRALAGKSSAGLVREQELGVSHEQSRERHPPSLLGRKRARPERQTRRYVHDPRRPFGGCTRLGLVRAPDEQRVGDVVERRAQREHRAIVEDHYDAVPSPADRGAAEQNFAFKLHGSRDHFEESGLAARLGSGHGEDAARGQGHIHRPEGPCSVGMDSRRADELEHITGYPAACRNPRRSCRGNRRARDIPRAYRRAVF